MLEMLYAYKFLGVDKLPFGELPVGAPFHPKGRTHDGRYSGVVMIDYVKIADDLAENVHTFLGTEHENFGEIIAMGADEPVHVAYGILLKEWLGLARTHYGVRENGSII